MKLTIQKQIGNNRYGFQFEGADLHECLMESQKISFYDLTKCGLCDSPHMRLLAYITKEDKFKYVKVVCNQCRGSLTLGQSKSDHAYYYRKDKDTGALEWMKFEGKDNDDR